MSPKQHDVFRVMSDSRICLASTSPRRKQLLASLGIEFDAIAPACSEEPASPGMEPSAHAARCARLKARSVNLPPFKGRTAIVSADTIVVADDRIMGKPADEADALRMLLALNGRWHAVYTAVCISLSDSEIELCEKTDVHFASWSPEALAAYANTAEPFDKAGSYAIQGMGAFLIDMVRGSWSNVVGLPLSQVTQALLSARIIEVKPQPH